jgi:hypothetical protein
MEHAADICSLNLEEHVSYFLEHGAVKVTSNSHAHKYRAGLIGGPKPEWGQLEI